MAWGHEPQGGVGAGVEEIVGEEGGGFVGGDTAVFAKPLFFVDAAAADASEKLIAAFFVAGFFVDALDDAFGDGFDEGDFVEGPLGAEGNGDDRRWKNGDGRWEKGRGLV